MKNCKVCGFCFYIPGIGMIKPPPERPDICYFCFVKGEQMELNFQGEAVKFGFFIIGAALGAIRNPF